jgi:hypothetical protein|tara:strand:+ start:362 stop:628 length:267 start_codon:yes stop_codon:yes gene_type:complete
MMEKLHISPSEIDSMPYYEYEYTLFYYNEILEERQEAEKKNSKDYGDKYNVDSMQKKAAKQQSSLARSAGSFKPPSMKAPSFRMPKLG